MSPPSKKVEGTCDPCPPPNCAHAGSHEKWVNLKMHAVKTWALYWHTVGVTAIAFRKCVWRSSSRGHRL